MLPTTILIDEIPRCVVRPTDSKDLNRFIRNGKGYLLAEQPDGRISHLQCQWRRSPEMADGLAQHRAWGGAEEDFFGIPL